MSTSIPEEDMRRLKLAALAPLLQLGATTEARHALAERMAAWPEERWFALAQACNARLPSERTRALLIGAVRTGDAIQLPTNRIGDRMMRNTLAALYRIAMRGCNRRRRGKALCHASDHDACSPCVAAHAILHMRDQEPLPWPENTITKE